MSSDAPADFLEPQPAPEPPALIACWRCGLGADAALAACPFCRARRRGDTPPTPPPVEAWHPLFTVILAYTVMLSASVVWGWVLLHGNPDDDQRQAGTVVLELFDAALTVGGCVLVGRLRQPKPGLGGRIAAWFAGPAALALVLAANFGYHHALRQFVGHADADRDHLEWSLLNVLLVALQPGVIEELFFRHLALGAMRSTAGVHAAVWVSAVMFALAHLYQPLGVPWLLVAGVVFGYCRVWSGGLLLPMLLHALHNGTVLWLGVL